MAKRSLTFGEKMEIKRLNYRWETASNEERKEIKARIAKIKQRAQGEDGEEPEEPQKSQQPQAQPKSQNQPKKAPPAPKQKPDSESETPANEARYMSYCTCTELMVMVQTDKVWMGYETYRRKHRDQTVFDIEPDRIAVMYLNHDKYQELLEADDDTLLDQDDVVAKCARLIPEEFIQIETAILSGLVSIEAFEDRRIKDLGYKVGSMRECAECGLFDDFFDGVIYNVLHRKMTLEDARYYAETGKRLPSEQGNQPPKGQKEQTRPKEQPKQKPAPKPAPQRKSNSSNIDHVMMTL